MQMTTTLNPAIHTIKAKTTTQKSKIRRPARIARQHLDMIQILGVKQIFMKNDSGATALQSLEKQCASCQKCVLAQTRKNVVFGEGHPSARIMIIGEAPGAEEDKQGRPFVGEAGKLLDNMLKAIEIERAQTYICNILKCRPPGNRDPQTAEREACIPHLLKQLDIIKPSIILILGLVAAQTLLDSKLSLTRLREGDHFIQNIPTHVTYHPAALLRNPNWKRPAWQDLQRFRDHFREMHPIHSD